MARIRSIKPDFWTDEKIVELSPLARLLFIGMWNFVDDSGRSEYSPARLKMQILPADSADIRELLGELRSKRLIHVYEVDNKEYFQVCGFLKHQKIDKRSQSKLPPPPELPRIPPTEVEVNKYLEKEKERKRIKKKTTPKKKIDGENEAPKTSLSKWFDEVMWQAVPSKKKCGKDLTWAAVQNLKPDEETRKKIVDYLSSYYEIKKSYDVAGEFFPEMQDPVRVIKHRRFEDVLTPFRRQSRGGGMAQPSGSNGLMPKLNLHLWSEERIRQKLRLEGESFRKAMLEEGLDPALYEEN